MRCLSAHVIQRIGTGSIFRVGFHCTMSSTCLKVVAIMYCAFYPLYIERVVCSRRNSRPSPPSIPSILYNTIMFYPSILSIFCHSGLTLQLFIYFLIFFYFFICPCILSIFCHSGLTLQVNDEGSITNNTESAAEHHAPAPHPHHPHNICCANNSVCVCIMYVCIYI